MRMRRVLRRGAGAQHRDRLANETEKRHDGIVKSSETFQGSSDILLQLCSPGKGAGRRRWRTWEHTQGFMSQILETLAQSACDSPVLSAVLALTLAWGLTRYVYNGQRVTASGGNSVSKDEALRIARERQQSALAAAAELRRQQAGASSAAPQPQPPAPKADPMPPRMKAALARAEAAAVAEQGASSSPALAQPPADVQPGPSGGKTVKSPNDPNSLTQRLARLEKGKGPSDHNPLHGHGSGSSAASSFVCKKKGG